MLNTFRLCGAHLLLAILSLSFFCVLPSQCWTPLHFASNNRHLEVVKLLLERGADVNAQNEDVSDPAANCHCDWMRGLNCDECCSDAHLKNDVRVVCNFN